MEILNSLWIERFRPKKLEDLVLPETYKKDFERCIAKREIPTLLLSGPAGSGKSTLARILTSKTGIIQNREDNVLEINGSGKETRGISFVQDVIEPYLRIPVANPDSYKIVFIDEADYLTDASFSSLRNIIEKYSKHGRFIFTCNYISKIPEAIQSRSQHYIFKQMPVDFIVEYCDNILKTENITYEGKDLRYIIDNLYPDVRRIVGVLQKSSSSGKLVIDRETTLTNEKILIASFLEIISYIQNNEDSKIGNSVSNMIKLLGELDMDYRSIYTELFFRDNVPINVKILINKYSNGHNDCLVPSIHWMSLVFETIQTLQNYKKLTGK